MRLLQARAVEAGKGCPVFLKRTHKNTLKHLPIEKLKKYLQMKCALIKAQTYIIHIEVKIILVELLR